MSDENIRMSDVFKLPVLETRLELYGYDEAKPVTWREAEAYVARAINIHDAMQDRINTLELLLKEVQWNLRKNPAITGTVWAKNSLNETLYERIESVLEGGIGND